MIPRRLSQGSPSERHLHHYASSNRATTEGEKDDPTRPVHEMLADQARPVVPNPSMDDAARLRAMVDQYFDLVWRTIRRLGVPQTDLDDCVQKVFWTASRKLSSIVSGSEKAFLLSTSVRVASDARRSMKRRREVPDDAEIVQIDPNPQPDELMDQKQLRALLDDVLSQMPMDLRSVFVLFELEEVSTAEIASLLDIPTGTVASRLRRAREEFDRLVVRLRASHPVRQGKP